MISERPLDLWGCLWCEELEEILELLREDDLYAIPEEHRCCGQQEDSGVIWRRYAFQFNEIYDRVGDIEIICNEGKKHCKLPCELIKEMGLSSEIFRVSELKELSNDAA